MYAEYPGGHPYQIPLPTAEVTMNDINRGVSKPTAKSKRVRTGCLTCRGRHLKCDEAVPICRNCEKGGRKCIRGIRLNFSNTTVHDSSYLVPVGTRKSDIVHIRLVMFQDDSRRIASEYKGGTRRYADVPQSPPADYNVKAEMQSLSPGPPPAEHILQGHTWHVYISPEGSNSTGSMYSDSLILQATEWRKGGQVGSGPMSLSEVEDRSNVSEPLEDDSVTCPTTMLATPEREFLDTPEQVRYMQVFVEEVAVWMDSFNKEKYFGECLPYRALDSPLLLYSLLACGIRRLAHRHPDMGEIAAAYYSTANMHLFRYLENPERDIEDCSIVAVILKLYNVMFREGPQSGGHSLALLNSIIDKSRWSAESDGIGSACFWLNAYLDIVGSLDAGYCLYVDSWSVNMDFSSDGGEVMTYRGEELWVQRMLFILAKVISYRLCVLSFTDIDLRKNRTLEDRLPEWKHLKQLCDEWNDACPRNMRPLGYMYSHQAENNSAFPKAWLPKREAVFCRLLYHTAEFILTQTHPLEQMMLSEEMIALQLHHAREVCGIVAHTEDRYLGPMSIQALLIASSALTGDAEQMEVLDVLQRMKAQLEYRQ
ncbi:Adhesion and hyphal regulator 1 [Trichoderma ghanense]|uniref:Adhesion and hyphal regulator 1 n=1 Tax=Trichoderma ghanense TaxID=65468 RepID=A0ABY2H8Y1_9HYPO